MLRKIRIIAAALVFILLALLFLDFTGTLHPCIGWLAKIQLVPAVLAHSIAVIVVLVGLTFLFGRVYCSVLCPLGVAQDCISNVSGRLGKKKSRFSFSKAKTWLRYGALGLFIVALVAHINIIVSLLDPYSAFGRMATSLLAPIYRLGNNVLAWLAEAVNSYAFYATDVWKGTWITLTIAVATLIVIALLAWRNGRTYCNTICPVGTFLGLISQFSFYKASINTEKCTNCGLCEKGCKASCIDSKTMTIDHSRCVTCFNCIDNCKFGGVKYGLALKKKVEAEQKNAPVQEFALVDGNNSAVTRRSVMAIAWGLVMAKTLKAQENNVDGGLAELVDKKVPDRKTPVIPAGADSLQRMKRHCTACQLCVSSCPNGILRPSSKLSSLMQPEMSFERGYCRPECTECSQVCPTGAINKITPAEKTGISRGCSYWISDNCIVNRDEVQCRSCERHCPTGAISLHAPGHQQGQEPGQGRGQGPGGRRANAPLRTPVIDKEKCIGCGACEYYCPARPFSAIYVEGHHRHHTV